ncbi:hypothetical protein HJC23_013204 [Cyclotella cryptica]|uniref:Na+/H+ antiporter NhaC-like C-terminal domain-containing protein n=1 Tax=Cyclotella cryptica TaxID=29204 RepID=A0ABD3QDQ0_9STRA
MYKIVSIHNNAAFQVSAALLWGEEVYIGNSSNTLTCEMTVDGVVTDTGSIDLVESRALPQVIDCGTATVTSSGTHTIGVTVKVDESESSSDRDYQSFKAGTSFIPLIVVLVLAATTQMVELSLGSGIFLGCCMITGSITAGFRTMLDTYLLEALASEDHAFVMLFILFMSGLVGIIEKSGGLLGITEALRGFVKTPRSAQLAAFAAGCLIFFDDYSNCLIAGNSMRPLSDLAGVSREKLAFIVDATAAPIASISPVSAWVGFEIDLIQQELNRIYELYDEPTVPNSGFGVFLQTIPYRYYCIFMLFFMFSCILSGRDSGPMLIAERLNRIYGRTDGGEGRALAVDGGALVSHNEPAPDTPCRWWNMAFPIAMLLVYIFYLLVYTGKDPSNPNQTFLEIMEGSDSYSALLWGTMAGALTATAFYFLQDKYQGRIIWFNVKGYMNKARRTIRSFRRNNTDIEEETETHPKILIRYDEAMSSFMIGMEKIFQSLVTLILAWASGQIMQAVGLNRLFGAIITSPGLDYKMLPTISFCTSILIAFATGTSWGTMTIMFPLIVVPSYEASSGDLNIVYGVIAGILAGAVAGDHASPISDTTILGAMASECKLLNHVKTQAPYAFITAIWSILVGTIPSGKASLNNGVCILLGFLASVFSTTLPAAAPINKTGRFDVVTELYILITKNEYLLKLKEDTKKVSETGETLILPKEADDTTKITNDMTKHLVDDEEIASSDKTGTGDDAEVGVVPESAAARSASIMSGISEVGPEDPLPNETTVDADKDNLADSTLSA